MWSNSILICFLLLLTYVNAGDFQFNPVDDYEDDYELNVDSGGTVMPRKKPLNRAEQISVTFQNKYHNETVELFWVNEAGEEYSMGEIESGNSMRIDTTMFHTFIGKGVETRDFVNPRVVSLFPFIYYQF